MMIEDGQTTEETPAADNGSAESSTAAGATEAQAGRDPENTYERVMLMALEARRLNTRHLERRIEPKERITTQAIKRVRSGDVKLVYGTMPVERPEFGSPFLEVSDDA